MSHFIQSQTFAVLDTRCYFWYVLLKITLFQHLELKIFDYGGGGTSGSANVTLNSNGCFYKGSFFNGQ